MDKYKTQTDLGNNNMTVLEGTIQETRKTEHLNKNYINQTCSNTAVLNYAEMKKTVENKGQWNDMIRRL